MFGCGTPIEQDKVGKERLKDHVKVYRAESIRDKLTLDAESLVLFAVLAGGDYNTEGLRGCGPRQQLSLRREKIDWHVRFVTRRRVTSPSGDRRSRRLRSGMGSLLKYHGHFRIGRRLVTIRVQASLRQSS